MFSPWERAQLVLVEERAAARYEETGAAEVHTGKGFSGETAKNFNNGRSVQASDVVSPSQCVTNGSYHSSERKAPSRMWHTVYRKSDPKSQFGPLLSYNLRQCDHERWRGVGLLPSGYTYDMYSYSCQTALHFRTVHTE